MSASGVGAPLGAGTVASSAGVGFAAGIVEDSYLRNAGEVYTALLEQKDINGNSIDEDTARYLAAGAGGVSALLEFFGVEGAGKVLSPAFNKYLVGNVAGALQNKAVQNILGKEGVKAVQKNLGLAMARDFSLAAGAEISTEAAQEVIAFGTEELGRAIQGGVYVDAHDWEELYERIKDTVYETFVTVGGVYGVGSGIKGVRQYRKSKKEKQDLDTVSKLSQSEAVKKYPYLAQDKMKQAFAEGNNADKRYTYFQAEDIANTLFQNDEGIRLAKELGISLETVQEAMNLDMPLSIETEKASTLLFSNDKYKQLADTASFDPNNMTNNKMQEYESQGGEYLQRAEQAERFADETADLLSQDMDKSELELLADSKIEELMDAGFTENQARQYARIWGAFGQTIAPHIGEKPEDFMSRFGIRSELSSDGKPIINYEVGKRNIYGQPINEGIDPDAPVQIVSIELRFAGQNPKVLRKRFSKDLQNEVVKSFENGIVNEDSGKRILMSNKDFHEHLKFEETDTIDGVLQLEAIAALPELARTAKLVESYDDKKNVRQIKKMHRFQGALRIGNKDYSVKLTVKEYHNGMLEIDTENPIKLYHHRIEKELFPSTGTADLQVSDQSPFGNSPNTYTLRTLLEDVKDSEGNRFYQSAQDAEAKLQADLQAWERTVDKVFNGEDVKKTKPFTMLSNTPLVLEFVGGKKDLPVEISFNVIKKIANKHNLSSEVVKQIPQKLTDPIAVFESATIKGDYVIMLELQDSDNATVVVPIALNQKAGTEKIYEANIVTSAYSKVNEKTKIPNDYWFNKQVLDGQLRYWDEKKFRNWLHSKGLQLPKGLANSGIYKKILKSKADLVKLKNDTPGFYQDQDANIRGSIQQVEGAKAIIRFFTSADISTGFHEFGHYMQFAMEQKARLENAREQDIQDWKTACDFVGAKEGEAWTREQHEKFADAVLEYLHRGEAPSKNLKRVFANIARWLTKLYEKISHSGVEINPQLKEVFDRQLATEKEILAARQKLGIAETNPILSSVQERDLAFLSPEKREQFNALAQDSDIDAYSAMTEKKGRELEEHKKIWNSNAELAYQLDKDTVLLEQIMDEGGIYIDEDLREQYRESLVETHRQRPAQYNTIFTSDKNKSVDIELAAERFGFEGPGAVDSFMGHIASLPNKERFIAEYVAEQEILWRSGWKAEEMVLNDKAEEALDILADGLAEKVGTVSLSRKQLHKAVRDSIKKGKIGDVEALIDKYETAARENSLLEKAQARKIAKLEEKVIRERLAFIEKKRVALAVVREKYKAKEMRNKGVRYVKRAAKTKPANIDFEYSEQIKYLAEKFGFTGKSLAPRDRANLEPIGQFVEKKDIDASVFPEWILASPVDEKINYKSLSVEEFGELMQVFKVLEHNGKDLKQVEIAGKKQNLEGLVKSLESTAESLQSKRGITDWEKNNKVKNGALAKLRKLASDITNYTYTFFALDGYRKGSDQVDGIFYQTFLKPLYDAQDVSYKLNREIKHKLDEALAPIKKRTKAQRKEAWTLDIPMSREVQRHWGTHNNWNYEKMIMVALNMGNADNMKKLMDGYGWTREHLDIITARMTAEDWNMVQDIWDTVNMLYPSMNAVYKEINGIPLKKVEANQLQTKYGVMRGGYFPLVFDSRLADIDTTKRLEFEKMQENSFSVNIAKAADGFTKDRKSGVKIPVLLSFDVIGRHVQDTVQYISFAKPVHEMSKIIRNKDFEGMYKDKFGVDIYNGLEAWLANIAKPQKERLTEYENIFEKARELGTVYALGYNIKTAVMSFTGFAPVVHEIGLVNTTKGMLHMLKNGREAYREIQAISPLMADRPKNINQDIAQNLAKYNPTNAPTISAEVFGKKYDFYWSDIQRFAFSMVTATDMMVSCSAWIGAYHKALQENGGDIEKARAYADLVVERTQSSGTAMHLTALQRGNGLKKIITMFMTYSLNYYNNLAYQTRGLREGKVSALEYASWVLWYHTMPAVLTVMINGLWNDGAIPGVFGDDEEERQKAWKEYGKEVFLYSLVQGIPVLRNLSSVYEYNQSNVSGSSIIDKGLTSPVQSLYYAGQTFFSLFDDSVDGDKALGKFIKHSIDATSYLTAVPAHKVLQLYDKANRILDWYTENR